MYRRSILQSHQKFRARTIEGLAQSVQQVLGARCIRLPKTKTVDAVANYIELATGGIWFCNYGAGVTLQFPESEYIRLQLPCSGQGRTWSHGTGTTVRGDVGCVSSADATIEFEPGFTQLVWRVRRSALTKQLTALTGLPATRELNFATDMRLDTAESRNLQTILISLIDVKERTGGPPSDLVATELEQAMITALLCASSHNHLSTFRENTEKPTTWQVQQAEEFIEANCARPLKIEEIAAAANAGVRSIYRAFKLTRGYTPMEFAKQRRLLQAQRNLMHPGNGATVTSIALHSGFSDGSTFSREFTKAFGQTPSSVLALGRASAK